MMSREMLEDTPDEDQTMVWGVPAASRLGDYELRRELGRGGFSVVYEARHLQRNDLVALKTLPNRVEGQTQSHKDAERLHKFRREFRALSDVNHPNLVGMQSLEVDGDQWFLTMDLVDGVDFISHVRPDGRLDEDRLRAALPQLVSGIMALHVEHVIHRDLKPSNVMVTEQGQVQVLDFGLVGEFNHSPIGSTVNLSRNYAGTPPYSAPEQLSGDWSAASDWYAVGVVLYEALAGEVPFEGPGIEVLTRKTIEDPPTLIGRSGIAADLAELAMRLLMRKPEDRPDSLEIARVISANLPASSSSKSSEQILVGRDTHLQSIQQAYDSFVSSRNAITLFVEGRSGEGKTTLVEHFLNSLRSSSDAVVLSGRCYDRESMPLKALDSLIDPLCNWLSSQKENAVDYLPDDIHMLAHLFPVMRRVDAVASTATKPVGRIDMKQVRHRAFLALREMFHRISHEHSVILFIDDLHWGDADSAGAIFELLKPPNPPSVMLLGTYRSDEADEAPFLRNWRQRHGGDNVGDHLVSLAPLSLEDCVELVVTRMRGDSESLRRRAVAIFEATSGNPYFLDQLIECLEAGIDTFQALPLHEIIDRKLQQLPESANHLLKLISLSGHAVSLEEVSLAAGEDRGVVSTLTHMRTERLVRLIDSSGQQLVDTYHDKIRELTIERLSGGERKNLHCALGETIEQLESLFAESTAAKMPDSKRVYDLAYHFDEGGDSQKALAYSLAAAKLARRQYALELAISHYANSMRYLNLANQDVQFQITAGSGETLLLAGKYADADQQLFAASELASDTFEDAQCKAWRAEIAYKTKSLTESRNAYHDVIRQLGVRIPTSTFEYVLSFSWYVVRYLLRRLLPRSRRHTQKPTNERALLSVRLLTGLTYPSYFSSTLEGNWSACKAETLASDFWPEDRISMGNIWPNGMACCFGLYSIGVADRVADMHTAQESDDLHSLAAIYRFHGYAQLGVGLLRDSYQNLIEAASLLETRVSDAWQLTFTRFWKTCLEFRLGKLAAAVQQARTSFELANAFSQHRLAQLSLYVWTRATGGNLPFAQLRECFEVDQTDYAGAIQLSFAETLWHLHHNKSEEALVSAECGVNIFRRQWILNQETVGCLPALAHSLRRHADSIQATDPKQAKRLFHRALKVARKATRYTYFLRLEYPFALREYALALATKGRLRKAYKFATKSCRIAEEQQASYELAQSRLVQAQLAQQLGHPDADEQIKTAQTALAEFQQMIESASSHAEIQNPDAANEQR